MIKKPLFSLFAFALLLTVFTSTLTAFAQSSNKIPVFTAVDGCGISLDTAEYKGKVLIIDFWATWCGPCRREIPDFIKLQNKYAKRGLQIIGISFDNQAESHSQFIKTQNLNYPSFLASSLPGKVIPAFEKQIGPIQVFPTTIFVNRQGKVDKKVVGTHPYEYFDTEVQRLL